MRTTAVGLLLVLLAAVPPASGQEAVQAVDARVVYEGPAPHAFIRDRIQTTVVSVAERLLLGRSVDAARQLQPHLAEAFAVLERVLTGYAVVTVTADIGAATAVVVRLQPRGEVVREAAVRFDLREVPDRLHPLLTVLLQPAGDEIRLLPADLPAASGAWASPLLEEHSRAIIERALAGYTGQVTVVVGTRAVVDAVLRPRDTRVIRNIGIRFRSTTLPNLLLDQHAPAVASLSAFLRGVPVAFALSQTSALERLLTDALRVYPPVQQYGIVATAALQVGETTLVTVLADSTRYRASVEAQLNIGIGAPGPAVVARAGRFIIPGVDTFFELRLVPNTLTFDWDLGSSVAFGPATAVGVSYTVPTSAVTIWTSVGLTPDLTIRGSWNATGHAVEAALRYRLNAFLAWEVVGIPGQVWVRLVSNL